MHCDDLILFGLDQLCWINDAEITSHSCTLSNDQWLSYLDALAICLSRALASCVLLAISDMKLFFVYINLHQAFESCIFRSSHDVLFFLEKLACQCYPRIAWSSQISNDKQVKLCLCFTSFTGCQRRTFPWMWLWVGGSKPEKIPFFVVQHKRILCSVCSG